MDDGWTGGGWMDGGWMHGCIVGVDEWMDAWRRVGGWVDMWRGVDGWMLDGQVWLRIRLIALIRPGYVASVAVLEDQLVMVSRFQASKDENTAFFSPLCILQDSNTREVSDKATLKVFA